jgi:hypothetical protein
MLVKRIVKQKSNGTGSRYCPSVGLGIGDFLLSIYIGTV